MNPRSPESKILSRAEAVRRFGPGRAVRLVFTNGCFELLHAGHIVYLDRARTLGEALVVAVNSDESARRLNKGRGRPIVVEEDRALLVAALESVDAVCVFDEDTPAQLIAEIVPDVLVKGSDYRAEDVVGRDVVEGAGGRVDLIPVVEGRSTTELMRRAKEAM